MFSECPFGLTFKPTFFPRCINQYWISNLGTSLKYVGEKHWLIIYPICIHPFLLANITYCIKDGNVPS